MQRIVASITTLEQHLRTVAQAPQEYRLSACPHCGLGSPWRHGCYLRKVERRPALVDRAAADAPRRMAPVCRFYCRGCRRTHSRLPLCIAPRRWFDWVVQQLALLLMLAGASVRSCARQVGIDRHTARRWRDWLRAPQAVRFAFHLRSQYPYLGRCDDGPPFWREVVERTGLARAMACLDRMLTVP